MNKRLPPTLPLPAAVQSYLWIRSPTQMMDFWVRRYGNAYSLKLLNLRLNLFSDPEAIRTIFAAKPHEMHAGPINRVLRVSSAPGPGSSRRVRTR